MGTTTGGGDVGSVTGGWVDTGTGVESSAWASDPAEAQRSPAATAAQRSFTRSYLQNVNNKCEYTSVLWCLRRPGAVP